MSRAGPGRETQCLCPVSMVSSLMRIGADQAQVQGGGDKRWSEPGNALLLASIFI